MRADGIVVQDDTMMFVSNPRSNEGSDCMMYILLIISVPLKRDELNINQIAPERGDNQVL